MAWLYFKHPFDKFVRFPIKPYKRCLVVVSLCTESFFSLIGYQACSVRSDLIKLNKTANKAHLIFSNRSNRS